MAGIDGIGGNGNTAAPAATGSPPGPAARNAALVPPTAGEAGAAAKPLDSLSAADQRAQRAEVQRSASKVQQMLVKAAPNLTFSIDKDSGRTVIKVIDPETHEVLRQIPADEILRMDKNLDQMIERLKGLLIDKQG